MTASSPITKDIVEILSAKMMICFATFVNRVVSCCSLVSDEWNDEDVRILSKLTRNVRQGTAGKQRFPKKIVFEDVDHYRGSLCLST